MDLLIATNNPGKVAEMLSLLADMQGLAIRTPADLDLHLDIPETGSTYAENATLKALAFAQASRLPALADDSGLELEALNGAPGLISARFAPQNPSTAAQRRAYLLEKLAEHPQPWKARFVSTLCLALPEGATHFTTGVCEGEIIPEERGDQGFGYDPIFVVAGMGRTMAELSMREKNQLSHRALAVEEMKSRLSTLLIP